MRLEDLGPGVLMFVGDEYESVATAFLDGNDVLLVDSLGSAEDARPVDRIAMGPRITEVRDPWHTKIA